MVIKVFILAHYKQSIKIIVKIDLFNDIRSKVLFLLDHYRLLHLIAFFY